MHAPANGEQAATQLDHPPRAGCSTVFDPFECMAVLCAPQIGAADPPASGTPHQLALVSS